MMPNTGANLVEANRISLILGSCQVPVLVIGADALAVKSLADIVELLRRNPKADLQEIGKICRKYRLRGWNRVLAELK